jgi:hypothetical protein
MPNGQKYEDWLKSKSRGGGGAGKMTIRCEACPATGGARDGSERVSW